MNEEEKEDIELDIEAKYVDRTEKEFLSNITYAECLYILDTKNKYCDDIKNLSLLKIVDIVNEQSKEIEKLKENNKTLKNLQNDTNRLYIEMIERKNYFERELQKVVDKIKAKIEVLEKLQKEFPNNDEIRIKIIAYKELLEKGVDIWKIDI